MKTLPISALTALSVLLAACGSDDPAPAPVYPRGEVIGAPVSIPVITKANIDAGTNANGAIGLTGAALCDVKISSVQYKTLGGKREETTATTAVMVPSGGAGCTGARAVLVYTHGTTVDKGFNMANVASNGEAALIMAMYAAQGFIVVAPNYTGYSGSSLPYHPYLNAEAQATDVIDAVRAARSVLASLGGTASAKLFVTGYSQGGHVAMATHREMQTKYPTEFSVTASGPMSGPHSLDKFGKQVYSAAGPVNGGATIFTPLLIDSFQNSYGNIYTRASDIYQSPYDTIAPNLLPTTDSATISAFALNKLPGLMFDPGNGNTTPYLIKTSFRTDVQNNPNNGLNLAGKKNDLLDFKPTAPVALCYGANDPVVFGFNSVDSAAAMRSLGAGAFVSVFNLEDAATVPSSVKAGFDGQKASISSSAGGGAAGQNAVLQSYHGSIVPPFCNAVTREFFRNFL
jgi:pimeloyl-ACP methyl ester carboxylesterase